MEKPASTRSISTDVNGQKLAGQKPEIDNMNHPAPMGGLKESRQTGENKKGSAWLRGFQEGQKSSAE